MHWLHIHRDSLQEEEHLFAVISHIVGTVTGVLEGEHQHTNLSHPSDSTPIRSKDE